MSNTSDLKDGAPSNFRNTEERLIYEEKGTLQITYLLNVYSFPNLLAFQLGILLTMREKPTFLLLNSTINNF